MNFIFYNILFIFVYFINNVQLKEKSICIGKNVTSEPVIDYCNSTNGHCILRCCLSNDFKTIIALDLTESNLTKIPDFTDFKNLNLSVIDLRDNPNLLSAPDDDFLTLKYLDDLLLPVHVDCPGGHHAWEIIDNITNPEGNRCIHQIDMCSNSTNICGEQDSVCSSNGPNHFLCLCQPNYSGYKCLRYGSFPTAIFFGTSIGVTIVASAILYWTHRRYVKK